MYVKIARGRKSKGDLLNEAIETVKQEFSLEKLRVRTFRRLKNVFSLCVVAYLFVTRYLRVGAFYGIMLDA